MDKKSLVKVAGDFNLVGMKKTKFMKKAFKFTAALNESIATHRKKGNLDNLWTNLQITSLELVSDLKKYQTTLNEFHYDANYLRPQGTIRPYSSGRYSNQITS